MEAWNIRQLKDALQDNLLMCNNAFERSMCTAIAGAEIRQNAEEWSKTRKLTPAELAIAQEFGFKGK